jgi:hypothetical protein
MRRTLAALGIAMALTGAACNGDTGSDTQDFTELRDLYDEARDLDLNDLLAYSAGFATDELNDALEVSDFASIRLAETEVYALDQEAANDHTLKSIDTLVDGLASRFGERELTTRVNRVRQQHLAETNDVAYAESAFAIRGGLHNWGYKTKGFDAVDDEQGHVRLGFDAGVDLEARIIRTVDKEREAYYQAPLAAIKETRGFVLPRGVTDLQELKPGESYALRGSGKLGVNVGVGVPILVTAVDALTYNLVVSAGLRTLFSGSVDVQLVKLDNNDVVVDVGIEKTSLREARVGLHDGWGVSGLVEANVSVAGIDVDLGRLVEKAIQKELNKKLELIDAAYERTSNHSRLSVARFRFDLDEATPGSETEKALASVLKADVRLAQALSNAGRGGVQAEFELSRSGVSTTSYAGVDILGMSFFRRVNEGEGQIVIQTPGGARAIYFDSLHKESGWFLSSHGYTRVGLSSIRVDQENPHGIGEANLIFQVVEGDKKMEKDKLVDHLDGLILGIGGATALSAVTESGNALQRYVHQACYGTDAGDDCRVNVLNDPKVRDWRRQGLEDLTAAVSSLEQGPRDLVLQLGEARLTANATYEVRPGALAFFGPPTSVVSDYRIDDGALDTIMLDKSKDDFQKALRALLTATEIDRYEEKNADVVTDLEGEIGEAGDIFNSARKRYAAAVKNEELVLPAHPQLGEMGGRAIEVRFPVDGKNGPVYEKAVARSLAKARSKVVTDMVDDLIDSIDASKHGELLTAYTLLQLTPKSKIDLRFNMDVDVSDWVYEQYEASGYKSFDVYARGQAVSRIDGGMFDLDQLIDVK